MSREHNYDIPSLIQHEIHSWPLYFGHSCVNGCDLLPTTFWTLLCGYTGMAPLPFPVDHVMIWLVLLKCFPNLKCCLAFLTCIFNVHLQKKNGIFHTIIQDLWINHNFIAHELLPCSFKLTKQMLPLLYMEQSNYTSGSQTYIVLCKGSDTHNMD